MTPMHRRYENEPEVQREGVVKKLKDYVIAMREVCEFYSVPVLDLYRDSGINPIIPIQMEMFMPDGLHPNNAGARRIALMLEHFLSSIQE